MDTFLVSIKKLGLLNVFRAFTINKNTNSDVKMELHIHKVRKTNLTWCRSQRSLCVDEERGSLHFGGSIEHNGLRQLFLPADSCQKAVGRLRCKTSSISWWIQCSDVAHGNAICTYWKWRIPTHFFACVFTTVYHTKYCWFQQNQNVKPLSHQTALPQRLYSVLKPCQRAEYT